MLHDQCIYRARSVQVQLALREHSACIHRAFSMCSACVQHASSWVSRPFSMHSACVIVCMEPAFSARSVRFQCSASSHSVRVQSAYHKHSVDIMCTFSMHSECEQHAFWSEYISRHCVRLISFQDFCCMSFQFDWTFQSLVIHNLLGIGGSIWNYMSLFSFLLGVFVATTADLCTWHIVSTTLFCGYHGWFVHTTHCVDYVFQILTIFTLKSQNSPGLKIFWKIPDKWIIIEVAGLSVASWASAMTFAPESKLGLFIVVRMVIIVMQKPTYDPECYSLCKWSTT